jgi:organic hydroperoxide reductase OsmC/OhrA
MTHDYHTTLVWTGNRGSGTSSYAAYGRDHTLRVQGKPDLVASSDPAFRGDADKHNPEDLFLAALASCHMLAYLAICARHGITVLAYEDRANGSLSMRAGGGGNFEAVTLSPQVTVTAESDRNLALALHEEAHRLCFIANSCSVQIQLAPIVRFVESDVERD